MMDLNDPVEQNISHFTIELLLSPHWVAKRQIFLIGLSYELDDVYHKGLVARAGSSQRGLLLNWAIFGQVLNILKDLFRRLYRL